MTNKLFLENITKVFNGEGERKVTALEDLNLRVKETEFVCILGKTGCGKTTLLKIMAGLETPTSGTLLINDTPLKDVADACTLVFQQYSLFPWLSIKQNVAFPLEVKGYSNAKRDKTSTELLDLVDLSEFKNAKPFELSGGMQQRVAIARALAYDPNVLLMDEPFGALDEKTRQQLQNLLLDIWEKKQKTIVFVTHNIDEAILLADRIIVMAGAPGRIAEEIVVPFTRPRNRLDNEFSKLYLQLRKILEVAHENDIK